MKIVFVQLPLHDHGHTYIQGNVEYAPAAMAAYIKRHVQKHLSLEFLPFFLSNFAANAVITRYITAIKPDIVSFTTYLWNLERNLHIAKMIKNLLPNSTIIFGGPEINIASYALAEKRYQVDYFVHGEGEWFFKKFLEGGDIERCLTLVGENQLITQPDNELIPTAEITEPFTHGYLNSMIDGGIFLELTRGCPYKCSYCYYSKNCTTVRELPIEVLLNALNKINFDLTEIYILSPTFNKSRAFKTNLELIAAHNPGIRLHTEMRADSIDGALAGAIYKAGFRSLEIGLQTLTPAALKNIGRRANVNKELQGMRHLKNAGIDLKIGIIPGLPGDTPARFMNTVETLVDLGFEENIELYPLMLLPGTRIRDMAESASANFQRKPPYYLIEGWKFPSESLSTIENSTTGFTGYRQHYDQLPDFSSSPQGLLVRGVSFDGRDPLRWEGIQYGKLVETAIFSFHIQMHGSQPEHALLIKLVNGIPHEDQLYNIILYTNHPINQEMILSLKGLGPVDTLHHRMNLYCEGKDLSTIHFYQVLSDLENYARTYDMYYSVTSVLRIDSDNYQSILENKRIPRQMLVGSNVYSRIKNYLLEHYGDSMENIAFERTMDMEDFYRSAGVEIFTIPEFSTRRLD